MTAPKALIFDVDGTLADTEELHRTAFNRAFEAAGIDWCWSRDRYRVLLGTTGGRERIERHAAESDMCDIDAKAIHDRKTEIYTELVRSGALRLRPGVEDLLRSARDQGIRLAIATTTSRPNVDALLDAVLPGEGRGWFETMACGEDVAVKKPDPEAYHLAMDALELEAAACLAFEDSRNGLRAALAAGLTTVVTPAIYSAGEDFEGAACVVPDLTALDHGALLNDGRLQTIRG